MFEEYRYIFRLLIWARFPERLDSERNK